MPLPDFIPALEGDIHCFHISPLTGWHPVMFLTTRMHTVNYMHINMHTHTHTHKCQ